MTLKSALLFIFFSFIFQQNFAQRNYDSYNRLGITGGLTLFDINTSNLITKQGSGVAGGFTTRGSFRNNFDLIYGISFYNSKIGVQGSFASDTQFIDYTIQAAQINFFGSYNIIKHHLSLEFGPILNINGKMKLDSDRYENYILEGYNVLRAQDIEDISQINFHVAGGITAGLESFRLSALYQYGVTNMLKNLNENGLENEDFEGHSSTITIAAVVYF